MAMKTMNIDSRSGEPGGGMEPPNTISPTTSTTTHAITANSNSGTTTSTVTQATMDMKVTPQQVASLTARNYRLAKELVSLRFVCVCVSLPMYGMRFAVWMNNS